MNQIKFDYEVEYLSATPLAKSGPARTAPIIVSSDIGRFVPAHITSKGEGAVKRFLGFFAAEIENENTRAAYYRAVCDFFHWCEGLGFGELHQIEPIVIAAYIKTEKERRGPNGVQSVKVSLAAIRKLFDYLVVGQVMPVNPALSVRGPKYTVSEGKTPVLSSEDAKRLIESIPTRRKDGTPDMVGLRDRALIGLMVYSLARISAALKMEVRDYRPDGKRFKVRLHEKGGKLHQVPVHHKAEEYLDEYIEAAGIGDQARTSLWRKAANRSGKLENETMSRFAAFDMIRRRAKAAGIDGEVCCHTFRATGITIYRKNGGKLEDAQRMANHASSRTTKLYDRTESEINLGEVERIQL